jgi:hypothetical protein
VRIKDKTYVQQIAVFIDEYVKAGGLTSYDMLPRKPHGYGPRAYVASSLAACSIIQTRPALPGQTRPALLA